MVVTEPTATELLMGLESEMQLVRRFWPSTELQLLAYVSDEALEEHAERLADGLSQWQLILGEQAMRCGDVAAALREMVSDD